MNSIADVFLISTGCSSGKLLSRCWSAWLAYTPRSQLLSYGQHFLTVAAWSLRLMKSAQLLWRRYTCYDSTKCQRWILYSIIFCSLIAVNQALVRCQGKSGLIMDPDAKCTSHLDPDAESEHLCGGLPKSCTRCLCLTLIESHHSVLMFISWLDVYIDIQPVRCLSMHRARI